MCECVLMHESVCMCVCMSVEAGAECDKLLMRFCSVALRDLKGFCQIKNALDCSVFCCCCFKCFYLFLHTPRYYVNVRHMPRELKLIFYPNFNDVAQRTRLGCWCNCSLAFLFASLALS